VPRPLGGGAFGAAVRGTKLSDPDRSKIAIPGSGFADISAALSAPTSLPSRSARRRISLVAECAILARPAGPRLTSATGGPVPARSSDGRSGCCRQRAEGRASAHRFRRRQPDGLSPLLQHM